MVRKVVLVVFALAVTAAVAVIFPRLVLKPDRPPQEIAEPEAFFTFGTIVDAPIVVPPGEFISYRVEFNKRVDLLGDFRTANIATRIECLILDEANFEAWKSRANFNALAATGAVPGGRVARKLDAGVYFIVVSARGQTTTKPIDVNVSFAAN